MVSIAKGKLDRLSLLQDPSYGVPFDVTFQIMRINEDEDKEVLGEVKGHKVVLAAFSEVFRDQFFGSLKETKDVIPVEETTLESFEKLIAFIYNKDIDWGALSVLEMYDVVNLVYKYRMPELREEVMVQIEEVAITMDNLMEVAHTATQFIQFPEVSNVLLQSCAKFLQNTIKTSDQKLQFAMAQTDSGQENTVLKLLVLAKDLPALVECPNCGGLKCRDGQVVDGIDKFKIGLKLKVNEQCGFWNASHVGKVYIVESVDTPNQKVGTNFALIGHHFIKWDRGGSGSCITPVYLYDCC